MEICSSLFSSCSYSRCLFSRYASRTRRLTRLRSTAVLNLFLETETAMVALPAGPACVGAHTTRRGYAAKEFPPRKREPIIFALFRRSLRSKVWETGIGAKCSASAGKLCKKQEREYRQTDISRRTTKTRPAAGCYRTGMLKRQ